MGGRGTGSGFRAGGNAPTASAAAPTANDATSQPRMRITGANLENLLNTTNDADARTAITALRDVNAPNPDAGTTAAGLTRTLARANTPQGTAAAWFSDAETRQKILNLLGDEYEFVQLTNSNANFMGTAMRMNIKTWRLRRKSAANG